MTLNEQQIEVLKAWAKDILSMYLPCDFEDAELEFIEEILNA